MAGKVTYQIVADDEKAQRQVNKFFYNMEKQSKQASTRVGRLNQQFAKFGKQAKQFAVGAGIFGGVAASARAAYSLINKMNEELERAQRLTEQQVTGYKKLTQLADTQKEARKLFTRTGEFVCSRLHRPRKG